MNPPLFVLAQRIEPERVARAVRGVLGRGEFGGEQEGWLARALRRVRDWISELFDIGGPRVDTALSIALYSLLALALAWLGWLVVRSILAARRARAEQAAIAAPRVETLAEKLARLSAEARAAEAAGEHLRALRLYFWMLVVGLSQRGDLTWRDAWTAREMLEHGRADAALRARLAPLMREIDARSFGGEGAGAEDCARVSAACRAILEGR